MALQLYANKPSMTDAAKSMQQELEAFANATTSAKRAADMLAYSWEGDAHDAFVAEQEVYMQWFRQMERLTQEFIRSIGIAVTEYTKADEECASILRSV